MYKKMLLFIIATTQINAVPTGPNDEMLPGELIESAEKFVIDITNPKYSVIKPNLNNPEHQKYADFAQEYINRLHPKSDLTIKLKCFRKFLTSGSEFFANRKNKEYLLNYLKNITKLRATLYNLLYNPGLNKKLREKIQDYASVYELQLKHQAEHLNILYEELDEFDKRIYQPYMVVEKDDAELIAHLSRSDELQAIIETHKIDREKSPIRFKSPTGVKRSRSAASTPSSESSMKPTSPTH